MNNDEKINPGAGPLIVTDAPAGWKPVIVRQPESQFKSAEELIHEDERAARCAAEAVEETKRAAQRERDAERRAAKLKEFQRRQAVVSRLTELRERQNLLIAPLQNAERRLAVIASIESEYQAAMSEKKYIMDRLPEQQRLLAVLQAELLPVEREWYEMPRVFEMY